MQIRAATTNDLNEICLLADEIAASHNGNAPNIFAPPPGVERDREFWAACISPSGGIMFVALSSDALIGFITAKLINTSAIPFLKPRTICKIGTIVVASLHKRRGAGTELIAAVEEWAKSNGSDEMRLEVFAFNYDAVSFYEALEYYPQSHIMAKRI